MNTFQDIARRYLAGSLSDRQYQNLLMYYIGNTTSEDLTWIAEATSERSKILWSDQKETP